MFGFSPHGDSGPSVLHLHPPLEHSMFTPSQYTRNGTWRGSLHWLGGELSSVFLLTFYWSELVPQSLLTSKQAEKCSLDVCPGKRGQNFEQPKDFATVFPPLHHTSICTCLPTFKKHIHPPSQGNNQKSHPVTTSSSNSRVSGDVLFYPSGPISHQWVKGLELQK